MHHSLAKTKTNPHHISRNDPPSPLRPSDERHLHPHRAPRSLSSLVNVSAPTACILVTRRRRLLLKEAVVPRHSAALSPFARAPSLCPPLTHPQSVNAATLSAALSSSPPPTQQPQKWLSSASTRSSLTSAGKLFPLSTTCPPRPLSFSVKALWSPNQGWG